MTISAVTGPMVVYGVTQPSTGLPPDSNEHRGPSMTDIGAGLIDQRPPFCYRPGQGVTTPAIGWASLFGGPIVDQVPSSAGNNTGILANQSVAVANAGVPFTLILQTSATSANVTTIKGFIPSTYAGLSNPSSITVLGLDCAPGTQFGGLQFGQTGSVSIWDPTHAISRCVTIVAQSTFGTSATFTFNGFDLYGYQMTETVTSSGAANVGWTLTQNLPKAFKYILSVTGVVGAYSTGTVSTVTSITAGVLDAFGFPLRVDNPGYVTAWWGPSSAATLVNVVSTASHIFASTATATSTTADVRGVLQTSTMAAGASNGTNNRLTMFISPSVQNLQTMSLSSLSQSSLGNQFAGLMGVPQF